MAAAALPAADGVARGGQRLVDRDVAGNRTISQALAGLKRLAYPKITPRAAAQRTQRHVPDSIATLRFVLACNIIRKLDRCPCCNIRKQR